MTISVTDAATGPYYPNGVTVDFPFDFSVDSDDEVRVVLIGPDGGETPLDPARYSVSISRDAEGGTVTFATPLANDGRVLWVALDPSFEQEILFEDEGPFNPAVLNPLADKAARRVIWLRDRVNRSIQLPFGETPPDIAPAAQRLGGKVLGFNAATGGFEVQGAGSFKGDPGGNVMAIGLFVTGSTLMIPVGADLVQTSGYDRRGIGVARYAFDPGANAANDIAYAAANPRTSFRSANGRLFKLVAEGWVDVSCFGARGDDAIDDTVAIQAAVTFMSGRNGGTLFFPRGDYKVSAPIDCGSRDVGANRVTFQGAGGIGFGGAYPKTGSRIYGTHAGNIFQFESCEFVKFDSLTFTGAGCSAIRQTGVPGATSHYLARLTVTECHFFGDLEDCILGNLIFAKVERNTFGFFGQTPPLQQQHRHIYSQGTGTNTVNINRVVDNLFFYAKGGASVEVNSGANFIIEHNDWEQNRTLPLRLLGVQSAKVRDNWFEKNFKTLYEIEIGAGATLIDNSGLEVIGNTFVHAGFSGAAVSTTAGSRVITVTTPPNYGVIDKDNIVTAAGIPANAEIVAFGTGTGFEGTYTLSVSATATETGVPFRGGVERVVHFNSNNIDDNGWKFEDNKNSTVLVTNNFAKLRDQVGTGFLTDATASGINWSGGGSLRFKRTNNAVTVVTSAAIPANAIGVNNVFGGLPFSCGEVAAGVVLSNLAGGIDVATNGGQSSFTLFKPGTLTPFTWAELGGRQLYITLTYFV